MPPSPTLAELIDTDPAATLNAVVAELRALPGSTPACVWWLAQAVADRLEGVTEAALVDIMRREREDLARAIGGRA